MAQSGGAISTAGAFRGWRALPVPGARPSRRPASLPLVGSHRRRFAALGGGGWPRAAATAGLRASAPSTAGPCASAPSAGRAWRRFSGGADGDDTGAYRESRLRQLQGLAEVYPHSWRVTSSVADLVERYANLGDGEKLSDVEVSIAGRVRSKRASGASLRFYDLAADGSHIQLACGAEAHEGDDFFGVHDRIHRGDIVGARGVVGKTRRGELSVFPAEMQLLSPCLHMLPSGWTGLRDQETRYRKRYLDLIVNERARSTFVTRSRIISFIRDYLCERRFLEVETPMMSTVPGGASARPFVTRLNELDLSLSLRIAPELYLKMLVIGGLERVFEVGRNFRNEGIDLTHNPEFTSCEFYMAYADYHDLMGMTEDMLSSLVLKIKGSYVLEYHADGPDRPPITVDFTPPWPRVSLVEELERRAGTRLPHDFGSAAGLEELGQIADVAGVDCAPPRTAARLLDKLCGHFIEHRILSPTFIIDHPQVMSPLAKWHRSKPGLSERFELFVAGRELCNAYTELNDPQRQLEAFLAQARARDAGDEEAQAVDHGFVAALEHGLPPTAGWGCGIDRLAMLLTDHHNIKEVILFPTMKPQAGTHEPERSGPSSGASTHLSPAANSATPTPS